MKNKQPENPLKSMEEQLDRILFNESIEPKDTDKQFSNGISSSIKEMKNQLIYLVKELKAKNMHLVA